MLVKLKRGWFDGATMHPRGTIEYNGPEENLPSDAEILSDKGRLPARANSPQPGHGAKPLEEQVLDLIPNAAPTHQIEPVDGGRAPALSDEAREERQKEQDEQRAKEAAEREKAEGQAAKDDKKATAAGLKAGEKALEKSNEATDPLAPFGVDGKKKS